MKIREGAYYTTRDGRTVGPATPNPDSLYPWNIPIDGLFLAYRNDGTICLDDRDWDIAAEAPTLWRDMTPEQKGALLLAHHEGKVIEALVGDKWREVACMGIETMAYRVRLEPKREMVTLHGAGYEWTQADLPCGDDTHRITFDLLDGEPDCNSIKMEKL